MKRENNFNYLDKDHGADFCPGCMGPCGLCNWQATTRGRNPVGEFYQDVRKAPNWFEALWAMIAWLATPPIIKAISRRAKYWDGAFVSEGWEHDRQARSEVIVRDSLTKVFGKVYDVSPDHRRRFNWIP